jgi:DNA-3-methyladenine glycosylase II
VIRTQHVMLDHPSWITDESGTSRRAARVGEAVWFAVVTPRTAGTDIELHKVSGESAKPRFDLFDPAELRARGNLAIPLRQDGPVARMANPEPWDAVATSIIRQVIRAGQARKLYRLLCSEHGGTVTTPWGTASLLPTPETVLALPDEEFKRLGLTFKRTPLRAAAQAYLDLGQKWTEIDARQLMDELQSIPRIGPWTAKATVTDLTNDYALYDYADLAVRTWATRLAPEHAWPEDPATFARAWEAATGEQLSAWTALTLAWGVRHANGVAL